MSDLREAAEMALGFVDWLCGDDHSVKPKNKALEVRKSLRQALTQPVDAVNISQERVDETAKNRHEWVGLSSLDKTFLRTTYAQLRPLYHDKKEEVSVAAEVVTDWDGFFAAIDAKLKEKNT